MDTPPGAPFKEKVRLEIAKLREMTFGKKLEHIWEYYKFPIIVICIALFIIGGLLSTWLFNPPPESALFVSWNSGIVTEEQIIELTDVLENRIINENANEEILISTLISSGFNPALEVASTQRTVAMVAAGAIDVFVLDLQLLQNHSNSGFIRPMERMLAEIQAINPKVYNLIEENATYVRYETEENIFSEHIMGINIGSSPLLAKLGFYEQELYFSVAVTSGNTEKTAQALIAFFE